MKPKDLFTCTDSSESIMYVKDEPPLKWEKENEEKVKLRNAIKNVAHKNSSDVK